MSLPSRERGLKFCEYLLNIASIESLPSRERGLKSNQDPAFCEGSTVAPLAGAWIEIITVVREYLKEFRRSPRGSVD